MLSSNFSYLKYILILCLLFIFSFQAVAQSPYHLSWKRETPYVLTGGVLAGLGLYFKDKNPIFTPNELETLDPNDINPLDRIATNYSSIQAHEVSNYLWRGSFALPVALILDKKMRQNAGKLCVLWLEAAIINAAATQVFKHTFRRPRPFVFDEDADIDIKLQKNAKASFLSGHTSMTATNTFFAAKVFSDYYPDSEWKPVVWGIAVTIPAITGYMRVRGGRHYPTDVMAGYALGAFVGYMVPHLHKKPLFGKQDITVIPGFNGANLVWVF